MQSACFYYGKPLILQDADGKPIDIGVQLDGGDDALPYVGPNMISAADGSRGRAYEKQRSIAPELLRRETAFDTAMRGTLCEGRDDLRAQFDENFAGLYAEGEEHYPANPRRSSYFGSRIATIAMRALIGERTRDGQDEALFRGLREADEDGRNRILDVMEADLAGELDKAMRQAARNCGLTLRNDGANVSLMGTTYSGIVFLEGPDHVETLTIQAGDSMAMAMVPGKDAEGHDTLAFRLLLPPQERESDGGMTNCIAINHPFYLRCAYHRLPKPCMLTVCSDGYFDAFPSMAETERFTMDMLCGSEATDLGSAVAAIRKVYAGGLGSDDSTSMAVCAFGFDGFEGVRRRAYHRMEELKEELALIPEKAEGDDEDIEILITVAENEALRKWVDAFWERTPWVRRALGAAEPSPAPAAEAPRPEPAGEEPSAKELMAENEQIRERIRTVLRREWLTGLCDELVPDEMNQKREQEGLAEAFMEAARKLREERERFLRADEERERSEARARDAREGYGKDPGLKSVRSMCAAAEYELRCVSETVSCLKGLEEAAAAFEAVAGEIDRNPGEIDAYFEEMLRDGCEFDEFYGLLNEIACGESAAIARLSPEGQEAVRQILSEAEAGDPVRPAPPAEPEEPQRPIIPKGEPYRAYKERPLTYIRRCLSEQPEGTDPGLTEEIRRDLEAARHKFDGRLEREAAVKRFSERYNSGFTEVMIQRR